jgi:hypothetical protein
MKHVNLDSLDDSVKQFVLGLSVDPNGAVLELKGHAVACVLPLSGVNGNGAPPEPWTEARNARRSDLIDREIDGTLTAEEAVELHGLQHEMQRYLKRIAPLPLADTRLLYQDLLARAQAAVKSDP